MHDIFKGPISERRLAISMLHRTVFSMDKIAEKTLSKSLNLTFSQFRLLIMINQYPDATQEKLAWTMSVSPPAVSRQVENLIRQGYVAEKGRTRILTSAGRTAFKKALTLLDAEFKDIFAGVDEKEMHTLIVVLENVFQSALKKLPRRSVNGLK